MLEGYQRIPDELLFSWQSVELLTSIEAIFSKPGVRTACQVCGEEIINEREVVAWDRSFVARALAFPIMRQQQPKATWWSMCSQRARSRTLPMHRQGRNGSPKRPGLPAE